MSARATTAKDFIASHPLKGLTVESCFGGDRFQLANACGATAAGWVTRVSLAVTRIAPGHTLRQNGSTARASELFKPFAANSARRIWGRIAERNFVWKTGAGSAARQAAAARRAVCSAMEIPSPVNEGITAA